MSEPAKAKKKKRPVSTTEATAEPNSGAFHHDMVRSLLKATMSSNWPTMNAMPDATAMRQGASAKDTSTAIAKPVQATRRAAGAPTARLVRSVTKKAMGKVNAPQVNQSLMGNCTR